MYSMPQHAVTNGYWKMENFRAQPMASSRRVVRNESPFVISLPFQRAVIPGVHEAHHYDREERRHLDQARNAERAEDHGPRVKEDELDIEQDKENRGEIELDRQPADG